MWDIFLSPAIRGLCCSEGGMLHHPFWLYVTFGQSFGVHKLKIDRNYAKNWRMQITLQHSKKSMP